LAARSVVYVPDFAVNSGGVIQVAEELLGYNEASARRKVDEIATTVRRILATSVRDEITPLSAAQVLAADRIREAITPESAFRRFEAAPAAPVTLETAPPPSPWTG
jgi:leucine dehydrogenase